MSYAVSPPRAQDYDGHVDLRPTATRPTISAGADIEEDLGIVAGESLWS